MKNVVLLLLLAILLISSFVFFPKVIVVSKISCKSQFGPCNPKLAEILSTNENQKLTDSVKNIDNLLSSDAMVLDYSIQYKFPDSLQVDLVERKSKFALLNPKTKAVALVDKSGMVTKIVETTNLPTIEISEPIPNVGERVTNKQLFALNILEDMFTLYQVKRGLIKEKSLMIDLTDNPSIIFPLSGDKDILLASLRLILAKLNSSQEGYRINEEKIVLGEEKTIDLRYKNPVIR